ncbi:MAG: hypothetical protein A2X50_16840 [Candidatus Rokubacteria bacterium GWF2_70_14]|nr:MAG: hypothetical protein A2X53_17225 [Candidatus Rokubacteria bacterium GWA2_70_23]OGK90462.1 MAG: hypothetical protein A2X50_16840 [Candidatus Rokubacteria bacterium GWF2_70_14]
MAQDVTPGRDRGKSPAAGEESSAAGAGYRRIPFAARALQIDHGRAPDIGRLGNPPQVGQALDQRLDLSDLLRRLGHRLGALRLPEILVLQHLQGPEDPRERVEDRVVQTDNDLADGGKPLLFHQPGLGTEECLVRVLEALLHLDHLGDVARHLEDLVDPPGGIAERGGDEVQVLGLPVRAGPRAHAPCHRA